MYSIIITVFAFFFLAFSFLLLHKSGMLKKFFVKLGLIKGTSRINWTAFSWASSLEKMEIKADAVFFGDSIIRGGNFNNKFKNLKIVNLGSSGDDLYGMLYRINAVKAVSPQKIFILGGINGLTNLNWKKYSEVYEKLIEEFKTALPDAQLFVHSVLPISKEKEKSICKNSTIVKFNSEIKTLAEKHNIPYIDIFKFYESEGVINPSLTIDGIHLKEEAYEIWMEQLKKYLK